MMVEQIERRGADVASSARSSTNTERIRAEQTRALYRDGPFGVVSAALMSALLVSGLQRSGVHGGARATAWCLAVVACAVGHLILCDRYRIVNPATGRWRPWAAAFTLVAFVEGVTWGAGAVLLTPPHDFTQALVVLLTWAGVTSAGAIIFGSLTPTYVVFLFPAMLPHVVLTFLYRYPYYRLLISLEVAFVIAMTIIAWRFRGQLIVSLSLRFANLDLAEDLRAQKEVAEQANRAKSQFLAAVSHDLRQPVHAIGLFISALRGRGMDDEARRLVDFIDSSVGAMGELFTALLDISKLDAGAVQPHMESVALGPLLDRLCREYAGEAESKGIVLRCRRRAISVESDAVLLERVVRNLICNAVRYTDTGGVVVGCRVKGDAVAVEVWDTGCGIPAEHNHLVFQEFHQVGNPERDSAKGVGLGLAIVKRTTALIGAEVEFQSEVGRGSLFRVTLPRAKGPPASRAVVDMASPLSARKALIFVIDDNLAIRQAMESLLGSWGHRIVSAESGDEIVSRAVDLPTPDLIICDYRLRGDETGADVLRRLQSLYDSEAPAMLITGDTAPERIVEAKASGFTVLHKPLSNAQLRAAVGNLLRRRLA